MPLMHVLRISSFPPPRVLDGGLWLFSIPDPPSSRLADARRRTDTWKTQQDMGVCMSQEIRSERIVNTIPESLLLPEKKVALTAVTDSVKPFTYENIDTPEAEKLGIVCMPHSFGLMKDRIAIFDFDESSSTFMQMVSVVNLECGEEPGRMNWSRSARNMADLKKVYRTHLVVPCMNTNRIYVIAIDGKLMKIVKVIRGQELLHRDLSCPYAVRTLPIKGAPVHVATLGDRDGDFVLLDRRTFNLREKTKKDTFAGFGGDFALQTRHNVLISCEWGHPRLFRQGLTPSDLENVSESFGSRLHVWKISPPELLQTIDLNENDGSLPVVVRFLHNTECNHAFACSSIGSSIFHLFMDSLSGHWMTQKVAQIAPCPVKNWIANEMPALLTDLVISMDDRWMYVAGWLHGRIWRFDISDPFRVSLVSTISLGGLLTAETEVIPTTPMIKEKAFSFATPASVRGIRFRGGPAIMQLSLDGRRLYVGNSFYKAWDAQFFPELISDGGQIVRVDINSSSMLLNEFFLIDMKDIDGGPFCPRDIRFFGGDCTSDNFL